MSTRAPLVSVVRALSAAGLRPRALQPGVVLCVCPVCGGDQLALHTVDRPRVECAGNCVPGRCIASLWAIADALEDHSLRMPLLGALSLAKYGGSPKPRITLGVELTDSLDEATRAIIGRDIYQRGGCLVDVVRSAVNSDGVSRPEGTPRIRETPKEYLREVLSQAADWFQMDGKGRDRQIQPPMSIPRDLIARGKWTGIRRLEGVVDYPVLRPDGTILWTPGYDVDTGIIHEPSFIVDVPEHPTPRDAEAAVVDLLDLVVDFPFASPSGRSAWLAGLLTPLARPAIDGPVPLILLDANNRGVGKTMLADLIGAVVLGRTLPRRPAPNDPDEWRKAMTSIGISADPIVLLDNVTRTLRSDVLDMVLTGSEYRDRLLGTNQDFVATIRTMFVVTANNAQISPDIVRRALHVRLDSELERPEAREGFKHPNVVQMAIEQRPRLLSAALTILRAYASSGASPALRGMGSYESWSRVVRGALVWVGLPDPGLTQQALREQADDETEDSSTLLATIHAVYGSEPFTAGQLLRAAASSADLMAVLQAVNDSHGAVNVKRVGYALRRLRGRPIDGYTLTMGARSKQGAMWQIKSISTTHQHREFENDGEDLG